MQLLALDTSTRQASIALCSEDTLYGEYTWRIENNHSVELLTALQRLLAECHSSLAQLDGVAVATGPGSFNGVRVAVATAKTLAFTLQKRLVGVSTLDVVAAQQRAWKGPICSLLEAGRGELYAACYLYDWQQRHDGKLAYQQQRLGDYLLLPPSGLVPVLKGHMDARISVPGSRELPPILFCGEISAASQFVLREQLQDRAIFAVDLQAVRHASTLAILARERLLAGEEDDPVLLEPLYLRRPSITTSTRKQPLFPGTAQRHAGQNTTEREEGALRR